MASAPPALLQRQRNRLLIALTLLSASAWGIVLWQAHGMGGGSMGLTIGMDATLFLAVWVAMMVAMMFPAAAPMILMFAQVQAGKRRQGQQAVSIWLFAGAYLALWTAVGAAAYAAAIGAQQVGNQVMWLGNHGPQAAGLLLVAAGIYQFTPLKHACLARCRSPLAFLMTSWRNGAVGAVRMGLEHGLYCLGCCWLFFAILFPLGMMNIAALAAITVLIFAEKALPSGNRLAWVAAVALIAYGAAVILSPGLLPPSTHMQM